MELVPACCFIGMDGAANGDLGGHGGDKRRLRSRDERNGTALPFADYDDGLALAGLVSAMASR